MVCMVLVGDCRDRLAEIPAKSIHTCVTSPPYFGLRDYGHGEQIGLEPTPEEFVNAMVTVFREVRRVLRDDGTVWLNLGDSYARTGGSDRKPSPTASVGNTVRSLEAMPNRTQRAPAGLGDKQLLGIPWRVAFALQADGWYLRQDIIWAKPNPMPESVKDRCTKSHEHIFLLSKSPSYYFDHEAIKEPATCGRLRGSGPMVAEGTGRNDAATATRGDYRNRGSGNKERKQRPNQDVLQRGSQAGSIPWSGESGMRSKRDVWTVATRPYKGAHFATFPPALIEPCVLAGCPVGGFVLDPFGGAGTTGLVAEQHGRDSFLIELNPEYAALAAARVGPSAILI